MKKCNKCSIGKPLNEFGLDKRNKDGRQGICEECRKYLKQRSRAERISGLNIKPVDKKKCNKCETTKPANEFYADAGISDGRATICKSCKNGNVLKWRDAKKEEYNEYMRKYRKRHPAKYEKERTRSLRNRYGITIQQYEEMLTTQNGHCALCDFIPIDKPLHVDHCHKTNKVRGLLCASCNRSMHMLDNNNLLEKAIAYKNK